MAAVVDLAYPDFFDIFFNFCQNSWFTFKIMSKISVFSFKTEN